MTVRILVPCVLALFLFVSPAMLSGQETNIRDFVHTIFVEGIPYDAANAYTSEVVPTLLQMLQDEDEAPYWSNIAVTLCIIGDESAVGPLISFIEADGEAELSDSRYQATSSAVMALGYLINKSGNQRALDYLLGSVDPDAWMQRGVRWRARVQASPEARNVDLSSMAILGLALSGRPEAASALDRVPKFKFGAVQPAVSGLIETARETHRMVSQDGLSEYYQKSRSGFGR